MPAQAPAKVNPNALTKEEMKALLQAKKVDVQTLMKGLLPEEQGAFTALIDDPDLGLRMDTPLLPPGLVQAGAGVLPKILQMGKRLLTGAGGTSMIATGGAEAGGESAIAQQLAKALKPTASGSPSTAPELGGMPKMATTPQMTPRSTGTWPPPNTPAQGTPANLVRMDPTEPGITADMKVRPSGIMERLLKALQEEEQIQEGVQSARPIAPGTPGNLLAQSAEEAITGSGQAPLSGGVRVAQAAAKLARRRLK